MMRFLVVGWAVTLLGGVVGSAPDLTPETTTAFNRYVALTEARMDAELRKREPFLWLDSLQDRRRADLLARLRRGEVVIERLETRDGTASMDVPDALVHHWVGTTFVPGTTVDAAVKLLQDYDRHAKIYGPNIAASKTLEANGPRFRFFIRFFMKRVIAVTMNTEHEAVFTRVAPDRAYSRIHSTRIAEVADAGTPREREEPPGQGHGFMWRLNTYWRFLERDGGTYVQCESVTLSRDIPFFFRPFISSFVTSVPRDSLTFTLERTRAALTRAG